MTDLPERLARRLFDRPLIQNSFRGAFVEEMLAPFIAGYGWRHCGDDWGSWDFEHASGAKLELKQSAAVQSWAQSKTAVAPSFNIEEKAGFWGEGGFVRSRGRPADVYVFAWHGVLERDHADHRRVEQWRFYVLPTSALPHNQRTIKLNVIRRLGAAEVGAEELGPALAVLTLS